MALFRCLASKLRALHPGLLPQAQQTLRSFGAAAGHGEDDDHDHPPAQTPTVFDKVVSVTVVDLNGVRHTVRGLAGSTLADALVEYGFPETYFFPNMGFYTQHKPDAHVFVPKEYHDKMPNIDPNSDEGDAIRRMFRDIVQDFQRDTSYFASAITLSPELAGMTIGIGPIKPWCLHTGWKFGGVHDSKATQFDKPTVDIFG